VVITAIVDQLWKLIRNQTEYLNIINGGEGSEQWSKGRHERKTRRGDDRGEGRARTNFSNKLELHSLVLNFLTRFHAGGDGAGDGVAAFVNEKLLGASVAANLDRLPLRRAVELERDVRSRAEAQKALHSRKINRGGQQRRREQEREEEHSEGGSHQQAHVALPFQESDFPRVLMVWPLSAYYLKSPAMCTAKEEQSAALTVSRVLAATGRPHGSPASPEAEQQSQVVNKGTNGLLY